MTKLKSAFERIPFFSEFEPEDFIIRQLAGFTNTNYHLRNQHHDLVLRIPKAQTNRFINRDYEAHNVDAAIQLSFAPEILWRDQSGLSLTKNCTEARTFGLDDMRDNQVLEFLVETIAGLHKSEVQFQGEIKLTELITQYFNLVPENLVSLIEPQLQFVQQKLSDIEHTDTLKVPSHNDLVLGNLLIQKDFRIWIIDWEYSAKASPYWDLATLCNSGRFNAPRCEYLLKLYRAQAFDLDANLLRDYQYVLQFLSACWMASFSARQLETELDWLAQIDI